MLQRVRNPVFPIRNSYSAICLTCRDHCPTARSRRGIFVQANLYIHLLLCKEGYCDQIKEDAKGSHIERWKKSHVAQRGTDKFTQ